MPKSFHNNEPPTPQRECAYCKQMYSTNRRFLDEFICDYCEYEIKNYFKRLCKSKSEFRENKK